MKNRCVYRYLGFQLLLFFTFIFFGSVGAHTSSYSLPPSNKPYLREVRIDKFPTFIQAFAIANHSDLASVALADGHVRIWNLNSGNVIHEFHFPQPETDEHLKARGEVEPIAIRFSPDGKVLAVSFVSEIYLYDVATWAEMKKLGVPGEDQHRADLQVTPPTPELEKRSAEQAQADKNMPVSNLNDAARAWARAMEKGDGRTRITDFAFTMDGMSIIAAYCRGGYYASTSLRSAAFPTGNDPVRLWDVASAHMVWERVYDKTNVINRIVASPDGRRFAAVQAHPGLCAVGMYRVVDGQKLWSHRLGPCADPPSVQFSSGGQSFFTNRIEEGNRENKQWKEAAIYETSSGNIVGDFSHNTFRTFDISSDGRWLVSATWSGLRFQVWDLGSRNRVMMETPKEWKWKGPPINRVYISPDGRWLVIGSNEVGELVIYRFGPSWLD